MWCHSAYGTLDLGVDEAVRRLPFGDLGEPADRYAVHAQPVAQQRPSAHDDRLGRDDAKAQQRGCDRLEVARVGEEREDVAACRPAAARAQRVHVHRGTHGRHGDRSAPRMADDPPFGSPSGPQVATPHTPARRDRGRRPGRTLPRSRWRICAPPPPALRDGDHVRGDPAGTLVMFYADFTCPRCALAHERLVAGRRARRLSPLRAAHQERARGAGRLAAEAAGAQGAFWAFTDALYADHGRLDDPHLWDRASVLGLDLARFDADRRADAAARACAATRAPRSLRARRRHRCCSSQRASVRGSRRRAAGATGLRARRTHPPPPLR